MDIRKCGSHELFRQYSKAVSESLGYTYPDYDEAVTKYTDNVYTSHMNY
ncbi:aminoglycoside 6-adenylyltransferase [Paenibacillus puerhi]